MTFATSLYCIHAYFSLFLFVVEIRVQIYGLKLAWLAFGPSPGFLGRRPNLRCKIRPTGRSPGRAAFGSTAARDGFP